LGHPVGSSYILPQQQRHERPVRTRFYGKGTVTATATALRQRIRNAGNQALRTFAADNGVTATEERIRDGRNHALLCHRVPAEHVRAPGLLIGCRFVELFTGFTP